MTYHRCLVLFLLSMTLVACRSAGAPAAHEASLDQEIHLAPGARAVLSKHGLDIEFVRVIEDSRCPSDTSCVWAGEVKVRLSIRNSGDQATQHDVVAGQAAFIGKYRVAVVQVQPEPVSTRTIAPEEYRVTLKVEPAFR
jgi:hypothetical protein